MFPVWLGRSGPSSIAHSRSTPWRRAPTIALPPAAVGFLISGRKVSRPEGTFVGRSHPEGTILVAGVLTPYPFAPSTTGRCMRPRDVACEFLPTSLDIT
jgi:hypothetical protein